MNTCITVGHSILKNGCITSADGRANGGCSEYIWCRAFGKKLRNVLQDRGHNVQLFICPEYTFTQSNEEKLYKITHVNALEKCDLLVELHLNAFDDPTANGTTVLYKTENGKRYADAVQAQLVKLFRDRGVTKRDDLYILNQTTPPAILLETFFCTNKNEYMLAKTKKQKKKIAKLVANGIEEGYKATIAAKKK